MTENPGGLPIYEITIADADQFTLDVNPVGETWVQAEFGADGNSIAGVDVRYTGDFARNYPKKSWQLRLPDGTSFEGRAGLTPWGESPQRLPRATRVAPATWWPTKW